MTQTPVENLSESMEMYLVTVARLQEDDRPVPLSELAKALDITTVSVNEMCRKLQSTGYLSYQPYKGANLTAQGEQIANQTLRRHRLWEVFLVEKLQMEKRAANLVSCELEHVSPEDFINRLDAYLEFPAYSPRGLPIPRPEGSELVNLDIPLRDLPVGRPAQVKQCLGTTAIREFLAGQGIHEGTRLTPIAAGAENLLVEVDGVQLTLSCEMAGNILVSPVLSEIDLDRDETQSKTNINKGIPMKGENMANSEDVTAEQIPLSDLKQGEDAVIVRVGGKGAIKRRMMDMGIVPGSRINVVRIAPLGDPIEFSIKGYSLSLRKSEAKEIIVELIRD